MREHDDAAVSAEMEAAPEMAPSVPVVLVQNHRAFLGFLERQLGDRAVAEDMLQEAFVRSIAKADTVRDQESLVPWFYRLLRNAVTDYRRRRASAGRALDAFAAELAVGSEDTRVDRAVCQCVTGLAHKLKPEYAEALARIEVEGVAVKDYAEEAGITHNNAGVRIFRARAALRKQVQKSCGACATLGCVDCTCASPA